MSLLYVLILVVPALATALAFIPSSHWTIRSLDFPRVQIAVLCLASLIITTLNPPTLVWSVLFVVMANLIALIYQLYKIFPYTRLAKTEVMSNHVPDDDRTVSLLSSNVLTPNRCSDALIALVRQYKPDLLLTLESDSWWQNALASLEDDYPHRVAIPLDNLYGMHLYSRLPLEDTEVLYRVEEDIPSIRSHVILRSGEKIRIYCLHPTPPSPTESETSKPRDAELLLVGKQIRELNETALVFGDLNDVAWSYSTRLFKKVSELLDARIGRGMFNTFHAHYRFLRWPLDHIFQSAEFQIKQMAKLPDIGSDHFPIYAKFQYCPAQEDLHEVETADTEEMAQAGEKIAEGRQEAE